MTRTWTYNAIALMAIALVVGFATVASATETTQTAPRPTTAKSAPGAGYTDPVRPPGEPIHPTVVIPRPIILPRATTTIPNPRDLMGSSTRPIVRPGVISSTTVRDRADQILKMEMKRLAERLLATITRMEEIIVRIESRAAKIDQAGGNTVSARVDIATAKTEIAAAKRDLSTIQAAAVSIQGAANMAAVVAAVSPARTAIESARDHLRKAEMAIESAVAKLAAAARALPKTATTTPRS